MSGFKKYTDYKTVLSVNALIWCNGKVLMLKRADNKRVDPGLYAGIGGKVEPHESFYDALIREIEEETGLTKFESIKPYSVTQHPYPPTDSEWVNIYFIVNIEKQVEIKPTEDGTFHWLTLEEAIKMPTATDIHDYLEILSKNEDAFIFGFFDHDKNGKMIEKNIKVL
jgi:8-oxo-dGTP diphosphatase